MSIFQNLPDFLFEIVELYILLKKELKERGVQHNIYYKLLKETGGPKTNIYYNLLKETGGVQKLIWFIWIF